MRNEWKFDILEEIDREFMTRVKISRLVESLEGCEKNLEINFPYPYLHLLKRIIKEIDDKGWTVRDESLEKAVIYLREMLKQHNLDDSRYRSYYRFSYMVVTNQEKYLLEKKHLKNLIERVKVFKREW